MTIYTEKKNEYWNHFTAEAFVSGEKPQWVTGPRLRRIKPVIWKNEDFWWTVIMRNGGNILTPEQLKEGNLPGYEQCQQNFWSIMREIREAQ